MLIKQSDLNTDKIILKGLKLDDAIINGYANAYKLFDIGMIVIGLSTPVICSFAKKRLDEGKIGNVDLKFHELVNKIKKIGTKKSIFLQYLLLNIGIGMVALFGLVVFGPLVINFTDKDLKYPLALDVLPILALSLIPMSIVGYLGSMIVFYGGEKFDFKSYIFIAITGLVLYATLIPRYGAFGAAISTLLIYVTDVLVKLVLIKKVHIFS